MAVDGGVEAAGADVAAVDGGGGVGKTTPCSAGEGAGNEGDTAGGGGDAGGGAGSAGDSGGDVDAGAGAGAGS